VEAGISYCELTRLLAANNQMVPLDPPFADTATIGGIVASNSSGPRRRLYGTARDMVIGMKYATLEGKLVQSGGMVVKNVAGLDTGKLMIGSFGTLAAIAAVNFKLMPRPPGERTFIFALGGLEDAIGVRDRILKSALEPAAIDLLNPQASELEGAGYLLAVEAVGNPAALARYERELTAMGGLPMAAGPDAILWSAVREFTPRFLAKHAHGAVTRVSCTLKEVKAVIESAPGPVVARAASGVCYVYFDKAWKAATWTAATARQYPGAVTEFAPQEYKADLDLWPAPGSDLEIMKRIKQLLDPHHLLNRGRLYNHI
jgi:glycolate dehydrogenase FAD-binding subunit